MKEAAKIPTGWVTTYGEAGRPAYTSPDGSVRVQDGGRGGERFQVFRIQNGQLLEDLGWPSLQGAFDYVSKKRTIKDHPAHRMNDEKRNWNQQMREQNQRTARLTLSPGVVDQQNTKALSTMRLKARNDGRLPSAVESAGFYAKKLSKTMYVYLGNSYMSAVWRVSYKPGEYLDPISNMGEKLYSVTPELVVSMHTIPRKSITAATYVQISRSDLENWLDKLPLHHKWHLKQGKAGIYLLPLSDNVAVKLSSTIGSSDDAMGRGMASMQLSLVSLITGQTLNKKAQGQGHFKRTTNWEKTWKEGVDRMKEAFMKAQGFYDALAAIEDRDKYKADLLKLIESDPSWNSDNLLADFHSKVMQGGILTFKQIDLLERTVRKAPKAPEPQKAPEQPKEHPLIPVLRAIWREAKIDRDDWLMDFCKSVAERLQNGYPLTEKQEAALGRARQQYRMASKLADRYLA